MKCQDYHSTGSTAFNLLWPSPVLLLLQYNTLNEKLPQYDDLPKRLLRSAIIGFSASAVSDTCSNSIRVIKTTKQTHSEAVTYPQVLKVRLLCHACNHLP